MTKAKVMQAGQLTTEGRSEDAATMARALHDQAVHDGADAADQSAVTQRLAAGVIAVVAEMTARSPGALQAALSLIEEARHEGRPAWVAAARALAARIMVESGVSADVLTMLALAELDLAEELGGGHQLDPPGGPTGPGAAANNLGAIYSELGLTERAERHLLASLRISEEEYGPDYLNQVAVDRVNLLAFRLGCAFELEADGDLAEARRQARLGLDVAARVPELAPEIDWPALIDWARILGLACLTFADPAAVPASSRHEVRAIIDTSPEGSLLRSVTAYLVLARLCRLAGDVDGATRAAERAERVAYGVDSPWLSWIWRESTLAAVPPESPALSYARTLRARFLRTRIDLAAALDNRVEMMRLERKHAEVRAARERLEQALAEAGVQEAQLRDAADHDPLTGLLNRASLHGRLTRSLAQASDGGPPLVVAFIDLDGFKQVNDLQGHLAGDRLLAAIANGLRGAVRETDTLARYGGDEFVCVHEVPRQGGDVLAWADRLRRAIEEASAALDPEDPISASIGVCLVDGVTGLTSIDVIARADAAMYEAKRDGSGKVRLVSLPDTRAGG